MLYTMLPPQWLRDAEGAKPIQKECSLEQALEYNRSGYNIYYYPNYPSPEAYAARKNHFVQAPDIDRFEWAILDLDLKHGAYQNEVEFIERLMDSPYPPTKIRLSGHGVHGLWRVTDLDGMSFLRLSRRLCRLYKSDEAVCSLKQLLRVPGTVNTKNPEDFQLCEEVYSTEDTYTSEQLDKWLPPITAADETYCRQHCDRAHNPEAGQVKVDEKLPRKFKKLLAESKEAKELFAGDTGDRSKADYRLAHLMFANGFMREEAMSVLVNCSKALERSPQHRVGYAENICDKVWTFEEAGDADEMEDSMKDILSRPVDEVRGTRIKCHPSVDNTVGGFRLGQVLGLVAGSGVGKTAFSLNMFRWFLQRNPELHHFFVALEETQEDIANRWRAMCQGESGSYDKVHVISNFDKQDGNRCLSLPEIQDYLIAWQKKHNKKIGVCVVDHIGALKKQNRNGESEALIDVCQQMKSFATRTQTFTIMMSQAPREKAGDGDLEMFKSCAYGTVFFESFCDWLVGIWQPVKRCHSNESCPKVTAYKFCKIRHKNANKDLIKEDVPYYMYFDPDNQRLRGMTQDEEESFKFFDERCRKLRKADRKTDPVTYRKIDFQESE